MFMIACLWTWLWCNRHLLVPWVVFWFSLRVLYINFFYFNLFNILYGFHFVINSAVIWSFVLKFIVKKDGISCRLPFEWIIIRIVVNIIFITLLFLSVFAMDFRLKLSRLHGDVRCGESVFRGLRLIWLLFSQSSLLCCLQCFKLFGNIIDFPVKKESAFLRFLFKDVIVDGLSYTLKLWLFVYGSFFSIFGLLESYLMILWFVLDFS